MERLRAVGVDAESSGPSPHENDAGAWRVWLHLNRALSEDEQGALQSVWLDFRRGDKPPVLNFPHVERARARLNMGEPEHLAQVVPKLHAFLREVQTEAEAIAAEREANRQRVRDAVAGIDWNG